ncbi:hypothetical protein THASP1DRAFT_29822 [Thamnocephalis sphaerospora]|uniref:BZIP domain-containing protein n=1 Tax=Thamnocephalis sphaerospora TaxID=78915 RepID=A0A4P9XQP6_9FUNG|nr:hypothetical protein THASP1DRAFT_29822 [Thamnocephalis sphaerospora]|eukprot:RKP08365.1 hypothetical protein THASP1DRAFT_29822 [Thamnocephalis sphaerospora]
MPDSIAVKLEPTNVSFSPEHKQLPHALFNNFQATEHLESDFSGSRSTSAQPHMATENQASEVVGRPARAVRASSARNVRGAPHFSGRAYNRPRGLSAEEKRLRNRESQRAFRMRRERYVSYLENTIHRLNMQHAVEIHQLELEIASLRQQLAEASRAIWWARITAEPPANSAETMSETASTPPAALFANLAANWYAMDSPLLPPLQPPYLPPSTPSANETAMPAPSHAQHIGLTAADPFYDLSTMTSPLEIGHDQHSFSATTTATTTTTTTTAAASIATSPLAPACTLRYIEWRMCHSDGTPAMPLSPAHAAAAAAAAVPSPSPALQSPMHLPDAV